MSREGMSEVLKRAADDIDFCSQLADDPQTALKGFNLTLEEKTALLSGDLAFIESLIGRKLDGGLLSPERSILGLLLRRRKDLKEPGRLKIKNRLATGLTTALVIVVIVATTLGIMLNSANHELSSARANLPNGQANSASIEAQLSSTEAELSSTKAQLSSTQAQLASVQTELSNTKNQLANTEAQLSKAQQVTPAVPAVPAVPSAPSPAPAVINKNAIYQNPQSISTGFPQMVINTTVINNGGSGQVVVTANLISTLYSPNRNQSKSISLYLAQGQQQEVTFVFTMPYAPDGDTYTYNVSVK